MTASYNGFKASPNPADFGGLDNSYVPGTAVRLRPGVRAGDVATVLFYVAAQLDKRVEPGEWYAPGDDWGYSYRPSKNDASLTSCHGSATAFDWNATKHPNGKRGTFTTRQVAEIRRILIEVEGTVYWGGDAWGDGTPDEMHWEIATGTTLEKLAEVAYVLRAAAGKTRVPPKPVPVSMPWYRGDLGTRSLQRGAHGDDVGNLQSILHARYPLYASQLMSTGIFEARTEAAVREFQKRSGLVVDGVAGRKTFRALGI